MNEVDHISESALTIGWNAHLPQKASGKRLMFVSVTNWNYMYVERGGFTKATDAIGVTMHIRVRLIKGEKPVIKNVMAYVVSYNDEEEAHPNRLSRSEAFFNLLESISGVDLQQIRVVAKAVSSCQKNGYEVVIPTALDYIRIKHKELGVREKHVQSLIANLRKELELS